MANQLHSILHPATYQDHRDQQQFFTTQDGRIAYTDNGKGPAIVLLHGVPASSWMYRKMMIPDLQKSLRVVTVDMLGYGSSDKPKGDGAPCAAARQAERVDALMTHPGIDQYSVLMHDMGRACCLESVAPARR